MNSSRVRLRLLAGRVGSVKEGTHRTGGAGPLQARTGEPAGLLGLGRGQAARMGRAGVGKGKRLPGPTRFPAGFRPSNGSELGKSFSFSNLFIICKLI
jgi:hypothetical protein